MLRGAHAYTVDRNGSQGAPEQNIPSEVHMGLRGGTRYITRVFSDGTGLTEEEIGLVIAGAAALSAVIAVLWTFDTLRSAWPRLIG